MAFKSRFLTIYFGLFALYAILIGIYLWLTSGDQIPDALKGTAADPATFLTETQLQQSEVYSVLRNWLFFIGYPWEWAIYLVLLFTGTAARWQEKLANTAMPGYVRFPVFVLWLSLVSFAALLPLRLADTPGPLLRRIDPSSLELDPGQFGFILDPLCDAGACLFRRILLYSPRRTLVAEAVAAVRAVHSLSDVYTARGY